MTKHSTYSAIMYYTSIVGARFGMHAQYHSVLVGEFISGSVSRPKGGVAVTLVLLF
jgi:hypothetical protein